jgi:hypothetical protein
MTDSPSRQVRLRGGPEGTASWVRIEDDGAVSAELYDHGESAQEWFGNDVAFLLRVEASEREKMESLILPEPAPAGDRDRAFLVAVEACFPDFFELKGWLKEVGIPFREDFDSWA